MSILKRNSRLVFAKFTPLLLPLVIICSMPFFRGAINFDSKQLSDYPSVAHAFIGPCLGLAVRAALDWDIISWQSFWFPFFIFSLSLHGLLLFFARDLRKKILQVFLMLIFCMAYGYGSTISLNGLLDKSAPVTYKAVILDKRVDAGKRVSYNYILTHGGQ